MVRLRDYLISKEKIIEHYTPVIYQETRYYCAITNFRILLYQRNRLKFTEIEHEHTESVTLKGGRAKTLGTGIAWLNIGILCLFFYYLIPPLPILVGIGGIIAGAGLIIYHSAVAKYFLQIRREGVTYQLFSSRDLISKLDLVIRKLRLARTQITERPTLDVVIRQEPTQIAPSAPMTKLCVHCLTQIRPFAVFCDKCGKTQELVEPDILPMLDEKIKYCTNCGTNLRSLAIYCDKCGKTIETPEPEALSLEKSSGERKFYIFCGNVISVEAIY